MGVEVGVVLAQAAAHVAGVEEERHLRVVLAHGVAHAGEVVLHRLGGEGRAVALVGPVEPLRLHLGLGRRGDRRELERDVHEDPVGVGIGAHHLLGLGAEIVEIGGREVEEGPADAVAVLGAEHRQRPVGRDGAPLGVLEGGELVPGGGEIDRRVDAHGVQRVDLGAQKVELQVRVHLADRGGVVGDAVVALGEDGDAVHVGVLERLGEGLRVEPRANAGDQRAGVEIQMDLAKAHRVPRVRWAADLRPPGWGCAASCRRGRRGRRPPEGWRAPGGRHGRRPPARGDGPRSSLRRTPSRRR